MVKSFLIFLFCSALFFAGPGCSSETPPLQPTGAGNYLQTLSVDSSGGARTLFYNYDYYVATNTYTGSATRASLEGLTLNSATVTMREAHRFSVCAYYPAGDVRIASNYANMSKTATLTFPAGTIYYYTNTLRFRIYDHDEAKEIVNADW